MVTTKKPEVEREEVRSITIHEPTKKDNKKYDEYLDYHYDMTGGFDGDWQDFKFDTHLGQDCKKGEYDVIHIKSLKHPDIEISIHVIGGKLNIFSRYSKLKETEYHNEFTISPIKKQKNL